VKPSPRQQRNPRELLTSKFTLGASPLFGVFPKVATTTACCCIVMRVVRSYSPRIVIGKLPATSLRRLDCGPSLLISGARQRTTKFPAQQNDVEAAYRWLLSQGYKSHKIVSGGHSVGGNLAVSLCIRLREQSIPLPEPEGKADQDRRKNHEPRPLCRVSDGRGRCLSHETCLRGVSSAPL
jgi:hypothetical protein